MNGHLNDRKVVVNPRESPQIINVSNKFGKIICPSRMLICGPSLSGKSTFLLNLVQHKDLLFDSKFDRIIYCSPQCLSGAQDEYIQRLREFFPAVELCSDLPDPETLNITADKSHKLILIDDFMASFNSSTLAFKLLTIQSHHMLISVAATSHNLFAQCKFNKTLTRNYSEIVLLYTRSDKLALRTLGCQMYPENPKILLKAMSWVERNLPDDDLKYIFLDISPLTHLPSSMILRTRIFPTHNIIAPVFFCARPL